MLGAQGVGKTSLLLRYIKNQFSPKTTTSTVGASFLTKRVVDAESDTIVRLQIWDTAGQERFRYVFGGVAPWGEGCLCVRGEVDGKDG